MRWLTEGLLRNVIILGLILSGAAWAGDIEDWMAYDRPASYEAVVSSVRPMMRDGLCLDCTMVVPGIDGKAAPGEFPGLVSNVVP